METTQKRLCMGCMSPLAGATEFCSHCGYDNDAPVSGEFLRPNSTLAKRYLVGKLISSNGEGALYLGYDIEEDRKVWVTEYAPDTLCRRNEENGSVSARSGREAQYKSLMYDFIENAQILRALRQNGSGGIVPVIDMVGYYGTAYTIYRYIDGVPLADYIKANGGSLPWPKVKAMIIALCKSLSALQTQGAIHRGVSPDSLIVDEKGRLWLRGMAISAARTGMSELCCELFEGYSAPEQYSATGKQGAWTDVYSCAAVLYRMLTGVVPVSAELRKERDTLYPANMVNSAIPNDVSAAIDGAMLVNTDRRTPSMDCFIAELMEETSSNTAVFDGSSIAPASTMGHYQGRRSAQQPYTQFGGYGAPRKQTPFWLRTMMLTIIGLVVVVGVLCFTVLRPVLFPEASESESMSEDSSLEESATPEQLMPDFTARSAQAIINSPQYEGKYTFTLVEEFSEDGIPDGIVISQSVPAGTVAAAQQNIVLTVSRGSQLTSMPYLTGSPLELAKTTLEDKDIRYRIIEQQTTEKDPGVVLKSSVPAGGQLLREQDTVILTVSAAMPSSSSAASSESESTSSEAGESVGGYIISDAE